MLTTGENGLYVFTSLKIKKRKNVKGIYFLTIIYSSRTMTAEEYNLRTELDTSW